MPSVAQEEPFLHPSKKRRRDDGGGNQELYNGIAAARKLGFLADNQSNSNSYGSSRHLDQSQDHDLLTPEDAPLFDPVFVEASCVDAPANPLLVKKLAPLPATKRIRVGGDQRRLGSPRQQHQRSNSSFAQTETETPLATPTFLLQHMSANARALASNPAATAKHPGGVKTSALAPCHVCFSRPTKKSDLDSYGDCERCGSRTCYVCMRECLGWGSPNDAGQQDDEDDRLSLSQMMDDDDFSRILPHGQSEGASKETATMPRGGVNGHQQMVCSRCCVEQGSDGDVMCLGCLQRR